VLTSWLVICCRIATNLTQYGRVERVYIDRQSAPAKVFVKFTNQLSALRVSLLYYYKHLLELRMLILIGCQCVGRTYL
jgi:hypothetical protein